MTEQDGKCDFCALELTLQKFCPYCNGTGEYSKTAENYIKNHICQCIITDRLTCPICKKQCHHDTSHSPKQTIDDGGQGIKPMEIK